MATLEELTKHFECKLTVLNQALNLFSGIGHDDFPALFSSVDQAMDSAREELHLLKLEVSKQNQMLNKLNDLKTSCDKFYGHIQNALSNIPSKLPCKQSEVSAPKITKKEDAPKADPKAVQEKNICCDQYINFITVDQFESVPKYMKGRLQYDKAISVITELNEAFVEKYKILKQKKSSLSDNNRKLHEAYRSQENKDTRGVQFIVDKDIESFTSLRMDNATRNILVILRHCGVMHEIRGGGYVRYASFC